MYYHLMGAYKMTEQTDTTIRGAVTRLAAARKQQAEARAVAVHEVTGEKQLGFGITVTVSEKITYKPEDAIAWAKRTEAMPISEVLDWKAFEKAAKAMDLPFVHRVITPSVRVAQDLEAVLAEVAS